MPMMAMTTRSSTNVNASGVLPNDRGAMRFIFRSSTAFSCSRAGISERHSRCPAASEETKTPARDQPANETLPFNSNKSEELDTSPVWAVFLLANRAIFTCGRRLNVQIRRRGGSL